MILIKMIRVIAIMMQNSKNNNAEHISKDRACVQYG